MSQEIEMERVRQGGCLCGAVRFETKGPLRSVVNCHCGQCRKFHGNFAGYTAVLRGDIAFHEDRGLQWFDFSANARPGFCKICGSSLFYDKKAGDFLSVAAGGFDAPSGLQTSHHIFAADKGDYYEITDGLEKMPAGHGGDAWPGRAGS